MSGWFGWFAFMAYLGVGAAIYHLVYSEKDEKALLLVPVVIIWPALVVFGLVYLLALKSKLVIRPEKEGK